jgi:hypothetical protein
MRVQSAIASSLVSTALAARPFLNEPDTAFESIIGNSTNHTLPELSAVVGLPDFDHVARIYLPAENYTYYRNGAAGEWSYRNNLEVFHRYRFRPRVLVDVSNINATLP